MRKTGENIFTSFLGLLHVKHTKTFSNEYFNEHPHKYNLFGISKMLSDYGIANAGTKIGNKEEDIFNIELPFIAHFGNEFVVAYKVDSEKAHYIWKGKNMSVPVAEFLQAWNGIILLAEPGADSGEPGYKENKKKELLNFLQIAVLLLAIGLMLALGCITRSLFTSLGLTVLAILNLLGVCIGYLLILKQMHIHSQYADKICSLFSQSDCNDVLESKAAKLFGVLGWSEIGLGYFTSNVLMLIFLPRLVSFLALINILVLPYSVWSIRYQKVKAKQWCPLCLLVQVLLWSIFAVNCLFGFIQLPVSNGNALIDLLIVGCIYTIFMLSINLLIPKLSEGRKVEQLHQEINSIKANEAVFRALLKEQPYYEVNKFDSQILFGNSNADLFITILTNPFCNPCAKVHKRAEKLLKETNGNVCIQYVFSSFSPDLNFANKNLIAVYLEKNTDSAMQIYSEWFEKGKLLKEDFFKNLQLSTDNPEAETEFQKHETWKEKTKLRAMPTILVNGCQLPENYKMEDLRYFTNSKINVD